MGETVKISYVDQSRDALNAEKTVWEEISGGLDVIVLGKKEINSRAYCARFNFSPKTSRSASVACRAVNEIAFTWRKCFRAAEIYFCLDEPSLNDLDVNTLRALGDAITEFAGSVMVISHDRWL